MAKGAGMKPYTLISVLQLLRRAKLESRHLFINLAQSEGPSEPMPTPPSVSLMDLSRNMNPRPCHESGCTVFDNFRHGNMARLERIRGTHALAQR